MVDWLKSTVCEGLIADVVRHRARKFANSASLDYAQRIIDFWRLVASDGRRVRLCLACDGAVGRSERSLG